jgi:hypothetical protein
MREQGPKLTVQITVTLNVAACLWPVVFFILALI